MNKNKYIELVNKDIDKSISVSEKEKLDQYLNENPEAKLLYKEYVKADKVLDYIPDTDPSENLKKKIFNSIDYNLYSNRKKHSNSTSDIYSVFSRFNYKLAASFVLGIITGCLILFAVFYNSTEMEGSKVFGTMASDKSVAVKTINVSTHDISGSISIGKGLRYYGFNADLKSKDQFNFQIIPDSDKFTLKILRGDQVLFNKVVVSNN